jgi:hypothetical protein
MGKDVIVIGRDLFEVLFARSSRETEEIAIIIHQDSRSPGRDLKPGSSQYEVGALAVLQR